MTQPPRWLSALDELRDSLKQLEESRRSRWLSALDECAGAQEEASRLVRLRFGVYAWRRRPWSDQPATARCIFADARRPLWLDSEESVLRHLDELRR